MEARELAMLEEGVRASHAAVNFMSDKKKIEPDAREDDFRIKDSSPGK